MICAARDKRLFPISVSFLMHPREACADCPVGVPSAAQDCIFADLDDHRGLSPDGETGRSRLRRSAPRSSRSPGRSRAACHRAQRFYRAELRCGGTISRIQKGFSDGAVMMVAWGTFTSVVLITFPEPLMRLFIPRRTSSRSAQLSCGYGAAEIFSCLEGLAAGIFQGMGNTVPPAVSGVACNLLRIPRRWGFRQHRLVSTAYGGRSVSR